ncbi:MAG: hypothetical protein JSV57_02920 [Candidatus Bathyarchaeota archaeon]|nr:MAG: hypothetical protein JSV57_02920 [Candidatus Bathyarchaeota archaeon]
MTYFGHSVRFIINRHEINWARPEVKRDVSADKVSHKRREFNSGLIVFIPFGALLIHIFHRSMPLKWASLASLLKSISLFSIYTNITRKDILWSIFGVWAFLTVCMTVYLSTVGAPAHIPTKKYPGKIAFTNLFKMCSNSVFYDYRTALLAKIPLVVQVLAAGSILYQIFGIDWVMHALAGFGIGAAVMKAYKTAVKHYGYSNLVSYFRLDRFRIFRVERKTGSAEFAIFGIVIAALIWELMERAAYFVSPSNVLRIGPESPMNIFGDMIFDIIGGIIAWVLINCKLKWF